MKLEDLQKLVAEQDAAQRQAAEAVKPAHSAALQAAQELHAEVSGAVAQGSDRAALKSIIEEAAGKVYSTKAERQQAGLIVQQHATAVADTNSLAYHGAGRDGRYLIQNAINSVANGYSAEQKQKVLAALALAASGADIEVGLIDFPAAEGWADAPKFEALRAWAQVLDAESVEKLDEARAEQAALLSRVGHILEALKQARPRLFEVGDAEGDGAVTVRSKRPGPIGLKGGIGLKHGDNLLTSAEYARLQHDGSFQNYVSNGTLEVVATAQVAQEV